MITATEMIEEATTQEALDALVTAKIIEAKTMERAALIAVEAEAAQNEE